MDRHQDYETTGSISHGKGPAGGQADGQAGTWMGPPRFRGAGLRGLQGLPQRRVLLFQDSWDLRDFGRGVYGLVLPWYSPF